MTSSELSEPRVHCGIPLGGTPETLWAPLSTKIFNRLDRKVQGSLYQSKEVLMEHVWYSSTIDPRNNNKKKQLAQITPRSQEVLILLLSHTVQVPTSPLTTKGSVPRAVHNIPQGV